MMLHGSVLARHGAASTVNVPDTNFIDTMKFDCRSECFRKLSSDTTAATQTQSADAADAPHAGPKVLVKLDTVPSVRLDKTSLALGKLEKQQSLDTALLSRRGSASHRDSAGERRASATPLQSSRDVSDASKHGTVSRLIHHVIVVVIVNDKVL